jgi:hypothetical protein
MDIDGYRWIYMDIWIYMDGYGHIWIWVTFGRSDP